MLGKKVLLVVILSLLLFTSCVLDAEAALDFPTFKEGEVALPSEITVLPQFSAEGNYGLVASADTLYHLELRHGRVHGRTGFPEQIIDFSTSSNGLVFVVTDTKLFSVDGFFVINSIDLPLKSTDVSVCSNDPLVLLEDGSIHLYSGTDLSLLDTFSPSADDIPLLIEGFPNLVTVAFGEGLVKSFSIPQFEEVASEQFNGSILFLRSANSERLILSTDAWNEVAICSPSDLKLIEMFTFSETPPIASADNQISCIYAVCPSSGLQVCTANGEIAWRTREFGHELLVTVSSLCDAALVINGNVVFLLLK